MRQYIRVGAVFEPSGMVLPRSVFWNNKQYHVEQIYDVRYFEPVEERKIGIRYICLILGKQRCLYFLDNRWFVELREE